MPRILSRLPAGGNNGFAYCVSDAAAQKRVNRAEEKRREVFAKNKVTIGVGILGILTSTVPCKLPRQDWLRKLF